MTDAATRNEDWLRTRSWDLRRADGELVTTLAELVAAVGADLDAFLRLPAAEALPAELRAELDAAFGAALGLKHLPDEHDLSDETKVWREAEHPRDPRGRFTERADAAAEALDAYLDLYAGFEARPETFVRARGRHFGPSVPRPDELDCGPAKACYANAAQAALAHPDRYLYAEGYATPRGMTGFATHHAWLVDRETGAAVDVTWPDGGDAYRGVAFETGWLARRLLEQGEYTILGPHVDVPDEALAELKHLPGRHAQRDHGSWARRALGRGRARRTPPVAATLDRFLSEHDGAPSDSAIDAFVGRMDGSTVRALLETLGEAPLRGDAVNRAAVRRILRQEATRRGRRRTTDFGPGRRTRAEGAGAGTYTKPVTGVAAKHLGPGPHPSGSPQTAHRGPIDARVGAWRPTNFTDPRSGQPFTRTAIGDLGERLLDEGPAGEALAARFGGGRPERLAGGTELRTVPLDFRNDRWGFEVKTVSTRTLNQKTAISADERARKLAEAKRLGLATATVLQVFDVDTGDLDLYVSEGIVSRAASTMEHLGTFNVLDRLTAALETKTHAAAVLLRHRGRWLLQRRSDTGEWALPGGALDDDEAPWEAMVREVREETGIEVAGDPAAIIELPTPDGDTYTAFVVDLDGDAPTPIDPAASDEGEHHRWVDPDEVAALDLRREFRRHLGVFLEHKHLGPGPHDTGTPQLAHAGDYWKPRPGGRGRGRRDAPLEAVRSAVADTAWLGAWDGVVRVRDADRAAAAVKDGYDGGTVTSMQRALDAAVDDGALELDRNTVSLGYAFTHRLDDVLEAPAPPPAPPVRILLEDAVVRVLDEVAVSFNRGFMTDDGMTAEGLLGMQMVMAEEDGDVQTLWEGLDELVELGALRLPAGVTTRAAAEDVFARTKKLWNYGEAGETTLKPVAPGPVRPPAGDLPADYRAIDDYVLAKMVPEARAAAEAAHRELARRFPARYYAFGDVRVEYLRENVNAQADGWNVTLSEDAVTTEHGWQSYLKSDRSSRASGFHVPVDADSEDLRTTIYHEYGHQIADYLANSSGGPVLAALEDALAELLAAPEPDHGRVDELLDAMDLTATSISPGMAGGAHGGGAEAIRAAKRHRELQNAYAIKKLNATPQRESGTGAWTSGDVERHVSVYAASDRNELLAEAFAEYVGATYPRPVARLVGGLFERLYGRDGARLALW